jgi:hypothetical protein
MYPTSEQRAKLAVCRQLWGSKNVTFRGPTERDLNLYVKCRGRAGLHRLTYSPAGVVVASSIDMTLTDPDAFLLKPTNALDN